jgi:hypothetical protein
MKPITEIKLDHIRIDDDTQSRVSINESAENVALTDEAVPAGMVLVEEDAYNEILAGYKETLADNEMMGRVFDANDQIKVAMAEVVRHRALAENTERAIAARTGEFIARAKQVTYWKNRAKKAEKALSKLR